MESKQTVFPAHVLSGAGVIRQLGGLCARYGRRALLIGGVRALAAVRDAVGASLRQADVELAGCEAYGGECSKINIDRLSAQVRTLRADVLIVAGGGKALDCGKAVGEAAACPVITLPTIAATCAAVTPLSVLYQDDGHYCDLLHLAQAPAGVVIDSQLLAGAPLRWLAAGLGDTLAKWYEYRAIRHGEALDGRVMAAQANSRICFELIERFGAEACRGAAQGQATPALEQVLDAIFLFAALTSIMGSGNHAAASHGLFEGFTVCDKTRDFGHGLLVGYGNLCLLALEQRSDEELLDALRLARECHIPLTLAAIAADLSEQEKEAIMRAAVATPDMANMAQPVSLHQLAQAMARVDALAAGLDAA
ncbi:iron-containing alcohol dehydrogenase family protein [Affinibrenneria salicis]|uniref:Iron-containing alcohol dehydrogenase family protein n=1 Tax=Affinibrenneria salicis TaxID=2590031 RepID=A0A5J5G189_9GAMM|nr:iron-containing alcohol dehydrogenase family protein [Affinibrenneria salicis]KAA9000517.1 iron-containing alcohol dehydrogenase family protein [Affinibrenneria salicis]